MTRYLRNRKDGTIYVWDEILGKHPLCEEVTEEVAFPERFIPEKQKGRKAKVDLTTEEAAIVEQPATFAPQEQEREASRGLPK